MCSSLSKSIRVTVNRIRFLGFTAAFPPPVSWPYSKTHRFNNSHGRHSHPFHSIVNTVGDNHLALPAVATIMSDQPGTADHANTISTAPQIMFEYMGDWLSDSDQRICSRLANREHIMLEELSTICHCTLACFLFIRLLNSNDCSCYASQHILL